MSEHKFPDPPPNFQGLPSKGIPGLDLLSGGGGDSRDKYDLGKSLHLDKSKKPHTVPTNEPLMHTSDDKIPFNFPPPSQDTNQQGSTNFQGPPNFPNNFQGGPPNNFQGVPPNSFQGGSNNFMSGPNMQGGPNSFGPPGFTGPPPFMGQGPPNFPPPGQGNFNNQFGNRPPFNQQPGSFPPNSNRFSRPDGQNETNQNFNSKNNSLPGLMDGFDPDRAPPKFDKSDNSRDDNQKDKIREWEKYYDEEDEFENDPFAENNDDYNDKFSEKRDRFDRPTQKGGPPNFREGPPDRFKGGNYNSGSRDRGFDEMGSDERGGSRGMDRFDGPPGSRDRPGNFGGPPQGPGSRFDGPPGLDNKFDSPAGPGKRFDGPPPGRFDGPPNFDGPPPNRGGPGGRFDGPPDRFSSEQFEEKRNDKDPFMENRYGGQKDERGGDRFGGPDNRRGMGGRGGRGGRGDRGFDESNDQEFGEGFDHFGPGRGGRRGGRLGRGGRFDGPGNNGSPFDDSGFESPGGRPPPNFDMSGKRTLLDTPGHGLPQNQVSTDLSVTQINRFI